MMMMMNKSNGGGGGEIKTHQETRSCTNSIKRLCVLGLQLLLLLLTRVAIFLVRFNFFSKIFLILLPMNMLIRIDRNDDDGCCVFS